MDDKTKKALLGSIKKWEDIVAGTGEDDGDNNCPLCKMFHPDWGNSSPEKVLCQGCPIREKTGRPYCEGSPYIDWLRVRADTPLNAHHYDPDEILRYQVRAQAELDFLRSLLPENE